MAQEPAVLPEDVLVEVLWRLPPHSIAASRWVCRAWRNAVDARLRSHLLSHSVRGIFINYDNHTMSEFLSRPSTGPAICGGFDFLPCKGVKVRDHCNGLVLCRDYDHDYVVNPATQRWARLPQRPPPHLPGFDQTAYLAFDPAVSPHYEVYLIPRVPYYGALDESLLETEWPPASHVMHVFSSKAERWDEKAFLREGEAAAGVVADVAKSDRSYFNGNCAVYWRGALYIHDQCDIVMRMCLSNCKYQTIKMPDLLSISPSPHLGRSMRGVYCALPRETDGFQLWHLDDESCGQMKWVLKHDINLESFSRKFHPREYFGQPTDKYWVFQDVNYRKCSAFDRDRKRDGKYRAPAEEKYEWNSDDDNILDTAVQETRSPEHIGFLGFHPYKEMIFLDVAMHGAVAYDWNSSKFQYLGRIFPKHFDDFEFQNAGIDTYFPYTPCWMHEFPRLNSGSQLEDEPLPEAGKGFDTNTPPGLEARWKKPVQGVFKINVHASYHEQEMQGATGLVVRDHVGSLISGQALWYDNAASRVIMEARAIRDALKLATERGYRRVEMESEAQEVVKLMKEPWIIGRSEIASIAREVKKLTGSLTSFSIAYVGTTANEAAQICASRASAQTRRCLWINYKPKFLIDILENDCNNSG